MSFIFWGKQWLILVGNKKKQTSELQKSVEHAIKTYLDDLDGEIPCSLFDTVIAEIEQPMLELVLKHCNNNQTRTARFLGINRGTLRKKLNQYSIEH